MSRALLTAAFRLTALALLCALLPAWSAGGGETAPGATGAGADAGRPRAGQTVARPQIQNHNPFKLEMPASRLARDASGISDLLVEVYDPEAGEWRGYGLMTLERKRPDGGPIRVSAASIEFSAPAEGIYCLRARERDGSGQERKAATDLGDVDWVVVLDRTPPAVELLSPAGEAGLLRPEDRLEVEWKVTEHFPSTEAGSNRVEVSHDGGRTWRIVHRSATPGSFSWEPTGPDTDALLVRVSVTDAAGNAGVAVSEKPVRLTGFTVSGLAENPAEATARRLYQQGVIYMTRGTREDCALAVRSFGDALSHDPKLLQAHVDLSATHINLHDMAGGGAAGAVDLQQAEVCLRKALSVPGFDKEAALHYNLAQVRCRSGRLPEAVESLDRGLAVSPRHLPSLSLLAYVRWKQRSQAAAAGEAARADLHGAEARRLWRQVAALGGSGDRLAQQAVRCLQEAERAGPVARATPTRDFED